MLTAMAAAGLGGYVLAGINTTRRGGALARDIIRADCQILLTDSAHRGLLAGLDLPGVRVLDVDSATWSRLLAGTPDLIPHREVVPTDTFMLIFTSGTSGEPKAVQVAHMMIPFSGMALVQRFSITAADVCYLSMPLFHSNALLAGWSVALAAGAAMAPATFSASGLLDDLRRYGVTYLNYVGKPLAYVLATREHPDDHDNPLRVAFGNEAADRDIAEFGRRFGCTVWDGFGSTEGAVIITRDGDCPPGSVGRGFPGVAIYDPQTLTECPPAVFDATGALSNPSEAIGEIVNTSGRRIVQRLLQRRGRHQRATSSRHVLVRRPRLPRRRRLDLPGRPHRRVAAGRRREPDLRADRTDPASPSPGQPGRGLRGARRTVGDAVMAAIVLRDGAALAPAEFGDFLAAQPDLSPKAWPRYVWIADDLPVTATNKVLKRQLSAQATRIPHGALWERDPQSRRYRAITATGPAH